MLLEQIVYEYSLIFKSLYISFFQFFVKRTLAGSLLFWILKANIVYVVIGVEGSSNKTRAIDDFSFVLQYDFGKSANLNAVKK